MNQVKISGELANAIGKIDGFCWGTLKNKRKKYTHYIRFICRDEKVIKNLSKVEVNENLTLIGHLECSKNKKTGYYEMVVVVDEMES